MPSRKQVKMSLPISTKEITSIQRLCHGMGITVNGQDFYDQLNTWLTHYLYGVDNVEKLASGPSSKQLQIQASGPAMITGRAVNVSS